ncbi:translation initiation factor IF-2 [Sporomusaceae bacterium FL31]|nr:translation initiation factor IF-2 [Sporomusaceae bacterium FL31]GCE33497.1 translation initiation factor IF-2 [Sporomusaceae bacterium]
MSKYRVYELAKEFNTTSKVILDILARNNVTAKNHMSNVGEEAKSVINRTFAHKIEASEPIAPETKVVPAAAPKAPGSERSAANDSRPNYPRDNRQQQPGSNQQNRPQHHGFNSQNRPNAQTQGPNNQARPNQSQQGFNPQNRPNNNQQRPGFNNNRNNQPQNNQSGFQQNRPTNAAPNANQPRFNNNNNQQRPPFQRNDQAPRTDQRPPNAANNSTQFRDRPQPANQNRPNTNTNFAKKPPQGPNRNQHNNRPNQQHRSHASQNQQRQTPPVKMEPPKPKVIKLGGPITVKEFAGKMGREVSEVIKKLMMLGVMATINQEVDIDTATILAGDFGVTVEELPPEEDPTEIPEIVDDPATLILRSPVVTVMGHVDHGKTSLLDAIRQTHVTAQEAGGITQHIGAYQVINQGRKIVFLDTPGHEAFTAMRARGAQVTDIAILVVAADDGVMPQTIEAINHAKSAKVPIIVAVNKMDREGANPDRVKQQLSDHGLVPEDWGGDTIMVPVSAHKKTGINDLLEMIVLVAEMQELKANPNRAAQGTIVEAQLDKGRGPVATVLIQKGTLQIGDSIIAGTTYGKVRAMINDRGEKVKKAGPSTPVEVLGLADVPAAGDVLVAVDEKTAKAVAEKRIAKKRTEEMAHSQKVSLDDLFKQIQEGNIKDLNIVIKADVQGSIEAIRQAMLNLNTNKEVRVNIVHAGVGAINESDVMLSSAANALIIGFNVRPDANARKLADTEKIDIRTYRVIYEAINDVEAAMTGMLAPEYKEVAQGRVEIRQVFSFSKGIVAGSYVLEGKITSSSKIRIVRNGIVVHEGELESLRRFKDDVKEVAAGYECGITIDKFRDIKEGDIIEAYTMEEIKRNS